MKTTWCISLRIQRQLNLGNILFLAYSNLFFVLSVKEDNFFSIIIQFLIPFILLLLVQFHLFVIISLIEDNFHKIILNIYFDHTHIMCLYRVFFVHCMGYTLVYIYR